MTGPTASETTHACPPAGSGLTPCCGRTPFELPRTDRLTVDGTQVTCGPRRAATLDEQLTRVRELVVRTEQEHGSVHLLVAPDNPLVLAGVTAVDGVRLHVEGGVDLLGAPGSTDLRLAGPLIYATAECMDADDEGRCSADPAWESA